MLHRSVRAVRVGGARVISTNSVKCNSTETVDVSKRDAYYKKLGAQTYDTKPAGWDEALPYEDIPGPEPIPILGNMWRFMPVVGEYHNIPLQQLHQSLTTKYGKIVKMKGIIGRKPMVFSFDPNDMENFLRNAGPFPIRRGLESFIYYRNNVRRDIFKGVGGVLTVQGEDWFKIRSVVNPILMQPRTAQNYITTMDQVANDLLRNMNRFMNENERNEMPENFIYELYKWALESMGVIALDRRFGCLDWNHQDNSEPQQLIKDVIQMFELNYKLDVLPPIWKMFNTPSWKKYVKTMDSITNTILKYIEEGLRKPVDDSVPDHDLSVLQRLTKIDKKIALAMTMDMLIAGIDTTGRTLAAALYFLARYPEKQELFREEVRKNLAHKDSPVTKEVLQNSPYLKAIIKETTRIAPIAVGNLRTTVKDLVLSGYKIPKGTEVIAMNLLLANSDEFKDPKKFIPERWLRTTENEYSFKNSHPFAFLPFGFGARSCVGKRLANLELEVALTKIIRNFRLSWPHEDMKFSATLLYGIANPLKLKIEPLER